jgi:hypothetical protein
MSKKGENRLYHSNFDRKTLGWEKRNGCASTKYEKYLCVKTINNLILKDQLVFFSLVFMCLNWDFWIIKVTLINLHLKINILNSESILPTLFCP